MSGWQGEQSLSDARDVAVHIGAKVVEWKIERMQACPCGYVTISKWKSVEHLLASVNVGIPEYACPHCLMKRVDADFAKTMGGSLTKMFK